MYFAHSLAGSSTQTRWGSDEALQGACLKRDDSVARIYWYDRTSDPAGHLA